MASNSNDLRLDGEETEEAFQIEIDELKGCALESATVDAESAASKSRKTKTCIFCGMQYTGGPFNIRMHLDERVKPRNVRACRPSPAQRNVYLYLMVLNELRKRQAESDNNARTMKELQAKRNEGTAIVAAPAHAFQAVCTDDVAMAWTRVMVKKALPLDLVDDPLFREATACTAKCGSKNLLVGNELRLPHRKKMTEKVLPQLDAQLTAEVVTKVQGLADAVGVTIVSDGWTNVQHKPIINALASFPAFGRILLDRVGHSRPNEGRRIHGGRHF